MSLMSDIGTAIKNKFVLNDFASQSSNLLTGGGTVSVSAAWEVKWSARFITISNGRGVGIATAGFFAIDMPAAATVITGVGGATNKTVTANGIPMTDWESLYYILPVGGAAATVNDNFRVVSYTADVTIPSTWIKICSRNHEGLYIDFACGVSLRNNTSINTNLYDVKGADVDGAVSTATKLQTARTINGVAFDGTANITIVDSTKAPIASPTFTGNPTAPTASVGNNDTSIATTAFVNAEIANDAVLKTGGTGSAKLPSGTTAQRDAVPIEGMIRYNSETLGFEGYSNGLWQPVGGGQMLGQALTKAVSYNAQTIAENIVIPSGVNAYSVGDVTIENGYTITIENGSVYKIL